MTADVIFEFVLVLELKFNYIPRVAGSLSGSNLIL